LNGEWTVTEDRHELPPDDFDAEVVIERQKLALAQFPGGIVRRHLAQIGLSTDASPSELALHGLVMDLYRRLDLLTGPADIRRADPLSFYEKNVSPVLQLLQKQRSLNTIHPPVQIDLRENFMGYNWHEAEEAHGSSCWRWMGPGPQSGIMLPVLRDMRMIRLIGRSSVSAQDSELDIKLNGTTLKIVSDRKMAGNLDINLEIPADIATDTQMNTFPWWVLQFDIKTHTKPSTTETRALGYGIGYLEILGSQDD
jgi:hypothetical protein